MSPAWRGRLLRAGLAVVSAALVALSVVLLAPAVPSHAPPVRETLATHPYWLAVAPFAVAVALSRVSGRAWPVAALLGFAVGVFGFQEMLELAILNSTFE
ncbi:hypothetical protein P2H44_04400 [Albimonas sp. CAU 1670]|uniref:hypothetical protein n=1 Tax=Albimonas sp. CAU 1670 TaxID=3032599 RepID=UPI0023DC5A52|nr:hypothetical protein [Albimonas sp. CAU 1670]MDF2231785.1 hypothetical protein [Albimonas sp. CAU 1670]